MIPILILVLVALVGVMLGRRHIGDATPYLMGGLAGLGILVAMVGLLSPGGGVEKSRQLEIAFEKSCGIVVGRKIAADVGGGGTVLLIQHVPAYLGKDVCEAQRVGLREGLGGEGLGGEGWTVDAVEIDVIDTTTASGINPATFDAARFDQLLQEHAGAAAVVSLIGFPNGSPGGVSAKIPPLYVLADWASPDGGWVRNKSLRAILTPKAGGGRPGALDPDAPAQDLFDKRYELTSR